MQAEPQSGDEVVRTVRAKATIDDTVAAIAKHSSGVTWHGDSAGLALILTAGGYA